MLCLEKKKSSKTRTLMENLGSYKMGVYNKQPLPCNDSRDKLISYLVMKHSMNLYSSLIYLNDKARSNHQKS